MKIELSNGYVIIKDSIDRKTMRTYRKALFANSETKMRTDDKGEQVEKLTFNPDSLEEANDVIVSRMVIELNVNEKNIALDEDAIDSLDNEDFDKILQACADLMKKKEQEKKS